MLLKPILNTKLILTRHHQKIFALENTCMSNYCQKFPGLCPNKYDKQCELLIAINVGE